MKMFPKLRLYLTACAILAMSFLSSDMKAGNYRNFKVSSYIMVQDVARLSADHEFRENQWNTISSQLDLDKIYIETYRDGFTIDKKSLEDMIAFFKGKGLEIGGGVTLTSRRPGT